MASVNKDANGWRIRFVDPDGHYLQMTDDHFDQATVAQKARETGRTVKPVNVKEPRKALSFRGSLSGFASVRTGMMGDEGLEPPTSSV